MRLGRTARTVLAAAVALGPTVASAAGLSVEYAISLAGLPIGTAGLSSTFEGDRYRLDLQAKMTGLVGAVTSGRGAANAAGTVAGGKPLPSAYAITSRNAKDQRTVRMGLAGGNVTAVDIAPPLEDKADRVPVVEAHKRGIVDPVSAVLMPQLSRGDPLDAGNCNRTIPVFDGAARFNVVLSYADTRRVEKPGYRGPVLVCNARYVPVSGHRPEKPATKFMEDNRDMSVWLAPVEGTRVLVPMRISVQTMVGASVIEASRWSVDAGAKATPTALEGR